MVEVKGWLLFVPKSLTRYSKKNMKLDIASIYQNRAENLCAREGSVVKTRQIELEIITIIKIMLIIF